MRTIILFSFAFLLLVLVFDFSCASISQLTEAENTIQKLRDDSISSLKLYKLNETRCKNEKDSISKILAKMPSNLVLAIDSLKRENDSLNTLVFDFRTRQNELGENLLKIQTALSEFYEINGNKATRVTYREQFFDCYIVDTKASKIQLFWKSEKDKKILHSLANLKDEITGNKEVLVFASNAGMYTPDNSPQGLYIQNGVKMVDLDKKKNGYGNFYMQPNGVFLIDTSGIGKILTTEQYLVQKESEIKKIKIATQSGPILCINNVINKNFTEGSDNKNIRNGVGIIDDHHVVFVISNEPVNFYDFASLFKERFNCKTALYLDGAISRTYLPLLSRFDTGGNFGPMIAVYK